MIRDDIILGIVVILSEVTQSEVTVPAGELSRAQFTLCEVGLTAMLLDLIDAIVTCERAKIHVVRDCLCTDKESAHEIGVIGGTPMKSYCSCAK